MTKLETVENKLPSVLDDIYDDVEEGVSFEGVGITDVSIPYLRILQSLSGEVKRGARYVEDAKEGDIFLSAVGKVYPGDYGVSVVPCAFEKKYIERRVGLPGASGYVRSHDNRSILDQTVRSPDGKSDLLPNGNHIVETSLHYIIVVDPTANIRAIVSFSRTQRKKSRQWLAAMSALKWEGKGGATGLKYTPPSFSHQYLMLTGMEAEDSYSWYGWVIGKPERIVDRQLALDAKKLYLDVNAGKTVVLHEDNF